MRPCVLPVDKPEGPTSHDIVAAARRALGERRIGHTGTLDPFASGLLLLCVGRATRLAEFLSGLDKSYDAEAKLGVETDTEDREGQVTRERPGWEALAAADVRAALERFRGEIDQVPPQYSAKKVEGVAMHRRARRGEHVELAPRRVHVRSVELLDFQPPLVRFRVRCSSGTYVRSLARDLGETLGVGGHLTDLRRTSVGGFDVADALPPEALSDVSAVEAAAIEPLRALAHLPQISVDDAGAGKLAQGQPVALPGPPAPAPEGAVAVEHAGVLIAVGEASDGVLRPKKVFTT